MSKKRIVVAENNPAQPSVMGFVASLPAHAEGMRVILVSDQKIYTSYNSQWLVDTPKHGWTSYADVPGMSIVFLNNQWNTYNPVTSSLELVDPPQSNTAEGTTGQVAFDDDYMYLCTNTNTWKRVPIMGNW